MLNLLNPEPHHHQMKKNATFSRTKNTKCPHNLCTFSLDWIPAKSQISPKKLHSPGDLTRDKPKVCKEPDYKFTSPTTSWRLIPRKKGQPGKNSNCRGQYAHQRLAGRIELVFNNLTPYQDPNLINFKSSQNLGLETVSGRILYCIRLYFQHYPWPHTRLGYSFLSRRRSKYW